MNKKILIVEDNGLNMKLFSDLLISQGYEVLGRTDAEDIVLVVMNSKPDLILMDIQLPTISGTEATKILKAHDETRHIPILAVSAFSMSGDKEMFLNAGCDGFLPKPIQVVSFITKVAQMLDA